MTFCSHSLEICRFHLCNPVCHFLNF